MYFVSTIYMVTFSKSDEMFFRAKTANGTEFRVLETSFVLFYLISFLNICFL